MTEIGKLLDRISVNSSRLSELSLKISTRLAAEELYLIAFAIDIDPGEMLKEIFKNMVLVREGGDA